MKKIVNLLSVIIMISTLFYIPNVVKAQTLGDLKTDLNKKQQEYKANQEKKQLTEAEIKKTNSDITTIKQNISQTFVDISNLEKDIDNLYKEISDKKKQVKQILNFLQVSNGESAYLEYVFGAESFTDLIYRSAITEQLASYNTNLVDEYNRNIDSAKKKQTEVQQKQVDLGNYQKELETKVASLGEELTNTESVGMEIQDSIAYQKEVIEMYEEKGCKDNENISTCGRSMLPPGTAFYRPTEAGRITSEWGYRSLLGRSWHEGIDVGVPVGTTVYAVATGMVAGVVNYSCGGNMVVVHHNINGATYTSVYAHLSAVNVSKGQTVTRNTVIGRSGGSPGQGDYCTTGAHLHVTIARKLFWVDYNNWTTDLNVKYSIDPRSVINFPSGLYNPWSDRITAY